MSKGSAYPVGVATLGDSALGVVAGATGRFAAGSPVGNCRFSCAPLRRHYSATVSNGVAVAGGTTVAMRMTAEAPFDAVRLQFMNDDTTAHTWDKVAVASGQRDFDGYQPIGASGSPDNTLFQPVTFAGAAAAAMPAAASAAVGASSAANNVQPGFSPLSDLIPLPSMDRYEGALAISGGVITNPPLLDIRAFTAAGARSQNTNPRGTAYSTADNGRIIKTYTQAVDGVTTPANFNAPSLSATALPVLVQFFSTTRACTIYGPGDSREVAAFTAGDGNPPGAVAAAALSTRALPCYYVNGGLGGQTTQDFYALALAELAVWTPDIIIIPLESPNDGSVLLPQGTSGTSAAALYNNYARALQVAAEAIAKGSVPILLLPYPNVNAGSTYATAVARLRAQVAAGSILYIDPIPTIGNGATPPDYAAAYLPSGDSTHFHFNQAAVGTGAAPGPLSLLFIKAISRVLSVRPQNF